MEINKKILIVEDDAASRRVNVDTLKKEKYTIFEAENGKEGLEIALREHPDLLLVDVMMPIMNGMEMVMELRKDKWGKNANIIILTNLTGERTMADFLATGAYDYLVKSTWSAEELAKRVKQKLETGI